MHLRIINQVSNHKITKLPEDSVNYVAFAVRVRLYELITAMTAAAHHRTDAQFDRPASLYENGTLMYFKGPKYTDFGPTYRQISSPTSNGLAQGSPKLEPNLRVIDLE